MVDLIIIFLVEEVVAAVCGTFDEVWILLSDLLPFKLFAPFILFLSQKLPQISDWYSLEAVLLWTGDRELTVFDLGFHPRLDTLSVINICADGKCVNFTFLIVE